MKLHAHFCCFSGAARKGNALRGIINSHGSRARLRHCHRIGVPMGQPQFKDTLSLHVAH
jgi:hypothetical protein